jgi:hypothetical protein
MRIAIATVGLLIFLLGAVGVARPAALIGFVERPWRSRAGLYVAVAFRAALGVLLIAAAASTRFPWLIGGLGVLALVAAVGIPLLGYARMRRSVEWWLARPAGFVRAWSLVACAFGAFLVYAAT